MDVVIASKHDGGSVITRRGSPQYLKCERAARNNNRQSAHVNPEKQHPSSGEHPWVVSFHFCFHEVRRVCGAGSNNNSELFYCDLELHYEWAYTKKNHHFLLIEPENAVKVKQDSRRTVTKQGKVTILVRYKGTFLGLPPGQHNPMCDDFFIKLICRDDVKFVLKR